jgi:hypothetical protein
MGTQTLTREGFVERYGRFFGRQRIETIQKLGYLLIEARRRGSASSISGTWAA